MTARPHTLAMLALVGIAACKNLSLDTGDLDPSLLDLDGDGYVFPKDCVEGDSTAHPNAVEYCDTVDNDCDGDIDEDDPRNTTAPVWYEDRDGDGYGSPNVTLRSCALPQGFTAKSDDCDDHQSKVNPGADETCDGRDDDCDGEVDEASAVDASVLYADADGDRYGDPAASVSGCDAPSGYVSDATDCDDSDFFVHPRGVEACDDADTDEDCDGLADDADDSVYDRTFSRFYADADGDGYGDPAVRVSLCDAPSGYVSDSGDCDDTDSSVHRGATEVCDASDTDEDCDGLSDDADDSVDASTLSRFYADADGDGYGDAAASVLWCDTSSGTVSDATDCDDTLASSNPGAAEVCDGADDDCDGTTDEADAVDASTWYADLDGDGYGGIGTSVVACDRPTGHVAVGTDCDDTSSAISPAASEVCDASDTDEDCDGVADDADSSASGRTTFYRDADGDGYGDPLDSVAACDAPFGYVATDADCDDTNASVNPGATETCSNGIDEDCNPYDKCSLRDETKTLTLAHSVEAKLIGETAGDLAGAAVGGAGDTDGDGKTDLLVGAYVEDSWREDAGAAYLVRGPVSGSIDLANYDAKMVGDTTEDLAGSSVAGAGDTNGDGLADILVGAPIGEGRKGAAYLLLGPVSGDLELSDADTEAKLVGEDRDDAVGIDVATAGDVNGDGYGDLLVGANGTDDAGSEAGAAYLLFSPQSGTVRMRDADLTLTGDAANDFAGQAVSGAGDFDGDGIDDVIVGAWGNDAAGTLAGAAYVVLGGASGTLGLGSASVVLTGEAAGDRAGWSVAGGGDVTGDGYDDVIVGAVYEGTSGSNAGAAYLLAGPMTGVVSLGVAQAKLTAEASGDHAGWSVSVAGDMDSDGYFEALIGVPGNDGGEADGGAVYVQYGPFSGAIDLGSADGYLPAEAADDAAGMDLAGLGDQDEDGYDDILIGASGQDRGGTDAGAAYLVVGEGQ